MRTDTDRYLSALNDLREAHDTWETAAEGDSNDAEHDAAHDMAEEVAYVLDMVTPWATAVPAFTTFVQQIAQLTPADNATNTKAALRDLAQQARDLLTALHPAGIPADPAAETVRAWADGYGRWHARISFPAPGYDQSTVQANINRLRQRARRTIRRALEERGQVGAGWQCRVMLEDTAHDTHGTLARSISFREATK